ncbi:MAG: flagellar biosynthesis anti-sigma factor FlgM [Lawsonibacter sp.]
MKILPGAGIPSGYNTTSTHDARLTDAVSSRQDAGRHFDQITITSKKTDTSSFQAELKTKLSKEIQEATSTNTISELRRQVQTGEYKPDPAAIARRMLMQED